MRTGAVVSALLAAALTGCTGGPSGLDLGVRFDDGDLDAAAACEAVASGHDLPAPTPTGSAHGTTYCEFAPVDLDGFFVHVKVTVSRYGDPTADDRRRGIVEAAADPMDECVLLTAAADIDTTGYRFVAVEDGSGYCHRDFDDSRAPDAEVSARSGFFAHSYLITVDVRAVPTPALINGGEAFTRPAEEIRGLHDDVTLALYSRLR